MLKILLLPQARQLVYIANTKWHTQDSNPDRLLGRLHLMATLSQLLREMIQPGTAMHLKAIV